MTDKKSLFISTLWVLAFFCSLPLIRPFEHARMAEYGFLTLTLLATMSACWLRGIEWRSPIILSGLVFWILAITSLIWTPSLSDSLVLLGTFSALPVCLIAFSSRSIPLSFYKYCAYGAGIIVGGLAAWAMIQYFFLPETLRTGQARHPFTDPNSYAAFLSLGFFAGLGGMMSGRTRIERNLALLLAILTLGGVITLGGRGPLIALVIALLVFVVFTRDHLREHKRCFAALGLGAAVIFALVLYFAPWGQAPLERLGNATEWENAGRRLPLWLSALAMAKDHMPLGTGFGSFFLFYPEYRSTADWYSSGLTAHNDALQILAELGPLGLILFYTFLITAVLRMKKSWNSLKTNKSQRIITFSLFCGLGAMIIHSHVNFSLSIASILMLSGMMLAAWHRLCLPVADDLIGNENTGSPTPAMWLLTLPALLLMIASGACVMGQNYLREAREALYRGDIETFRNRVHMADAITYGYNARAYIVASSVPLGILYTERINLMDRNDERRAMVDQTISLLDQAERANPRLSSVYYNRAVLIDQMPLHVSGADPKDRENALLRTLSINPQHWDARIDLAKIYWKRNETQKAYDLLKQAEPWEPMMGTQAKKYHIVLLALARETGDKEAADRIQHILDTVEKDQGVPMIPDFLPSSDFIQP